MKDISQQTHVREYHKSWVPLCRANKRKQMASVGGRKETNEVFSLSSQNINHACLPNWFHYVPTCLPTLVRIHTLFIFIPGLKAVGGSLDLQTSTLFQAHIKMWGAVISGHLLRSACLGALATLPCLRWQTGHIILKVNSCKIGYYWAANEWTLNWEIN